MSLHTLVILIILGLGSTHSFLKKVTGRWKWVSLWGTRVRYGTMVLGRCWNDVGWPRHCNVMMDSVGGSFLASIFGLVDLYLSAPPFNNRKSRWTMHGWSLEEKYRMNLGPFCSFLRRDFLTMPENVPWSRTSLAQKRLQGVSNTMMFQQTTSLRSFLIWFMGKGRMQPWIISDKLLSINQVRCIAVREAFVVRSIKCEVTRYIAKLPCSYCKLWILILLVKNTLSIFAPLIISSGKSSLLIFQVYSVLTEIQHFAGWPFPQCQRQWSRTFIFMSKRYKSELLHVLVAAVMWVVCFQAPHQIRTFSSKDHGSFVEVKEKKKKKKPFVPWFLQHPPLEPSTLDPFIDRIQLTAGWFHHNLPPCHWST